VISVWDLLARNLGTLDGECTRVRIVNSTSAWPNQVLNGRRFSPDHAGDAQALGHREGDVRAVLAGHPGDGAFDLGPVLGVGRSQVRLAGPLPARGAQALPGAELVGAGNDEEITEPGVSLEAVATQINDGALQFDIDQACGRGDFRPLARLTLNEVIPVDDSDDVVFDPTIHTGPGVEPYPNR